jgi:hypothetical protein
MAVKRSEIDTSEAEGDWLISIASQAGWAPQHHIHADIAAATARPNLWERSRYMTLISISEAFL